MKLALAVAALLFAGVVQAQSIPAYDVTGSADFLVAGQNFVANYSYTLEGPYSDPSVSNLSFTSSGQFGAFALYAPNGVLWDDIQWANAGGPYNGVLFDLETINFSASNTQIDAYLYDVPAGAIPALPYGGSQQITPVGVAEPSLYAVLIAGIGLVALRRWRNA